jgi:hypothetical protein
LDEICLKSILYSEGFKKIKTAETMNQSENRNQNAGCRSLSFLNTIFSSIVTSPAPAPALQNGGGCRAKVCLFFGSEDRTDRQRESLLYSKAD